MTNLRRDRLRQRSRFPGEVIGLLIGSFLSGLIALQCPLSTHAGDLSAFRSSVVSTALFLTWIPAQEKSLKLSSGQIAALRQVQGDFKGKSQEVGRRIARNAQLLSVEVEKYPIDMAKVKPAIEEISNLRGELTYHAIKSLYRVQTILNQAQWDEAKAEWTHVLATQALESPKPAAPSPPKTK